MATCGPASATDQSAGQTHGRENDQCDNYHRNIAKILHRGTSLFHFIDLRRPGRDGTFHLITGQIRHSG